MRAFFDWLDDRTGYRDLVGAALYEHIPGGARWRYVWGSTLVFAFFMQVVTGFVLWTAYSPSAQTAWESVAYIQYDMQGGWLVRGLHHFMAQAMVVLLALHLMQVVIDGAYRAPREINFWLGLILMQIVLGLALTGYLLPWDQKGFWATRVATNLMGIVPVVGADLQRLVVGGTTYGHHTLTRFFALHAGVLPALLVFFLVLHVALFRRHGIHARDPERKPDHTFWPEQVMRDAVACLAVLLVVLGLVFLPGLGDRPAGAPPGYYLGAELGAPADPASPYSAARPEWYFLFLFQFLKFFHGETEIYGAIVIPGAVMGVLFLMPILGRWRLGHGFNIGFLIVMGIGIGALTVQAMVEDRGDETYLAAVEQAEMNATRVRDLTHAPEGIGAAGALALVRQDPMIQGPLLFNRHCVMCHTHVDENGHGLAGDEAPTASNLYGFATREWIAGLLSPEHIGTAAYFGATPYKQGDMVGWVNDTVPSMSDEEKADLQKVVAALSAEAHLPSQEAIDARDAATIEEGATLLKETVGCADCHRFHDAGELGSAPDLTGYGSYGWLSEFISDPTHERFYREAVDGGMPGFATHRENPLANKLSPEQLDVLVRWLRGEWYRPEFTLASTTGEGAAADPAPPPASDTTSAAPTPEASSEATMPAAAEPAAENPSAPAEPVEEPASPNEPEPGEESPADSPQAEEAPTEDAPAATPPAEEPPAADSQPSEEPTPTPEADSENEPAPSEPVSEEPSATL
ncbi:MAG: cytochrome b N-terminal domain-containing protein [Pirellulales bacterium]|nr:cytochrome b N-terminal domain-containing protein [Pirellulales bacterium]